MSGEEESGSSNKNFSVSWILCCIIALGSPVALVGIIILTFTRKEREQIQIQTSDNVKLNTKINLESTIQDPSEPVWARKHLGRSALSINRDPGSIQTV